MYGSVPGDLGSGPQVTFDSSEDAGLVSRRRETNGTAKVVTGASSLILLVAVIGYFFVHKTPPPPKPIPQPVYCACGPAQLCVMGECQDRAPLLEAAEDRAFVFENKCPFTVWVAGIGPPTWHARPHITGFEMAPNSSKVISLPPTLESVRFWPRTGCRWVWDTISQMGKEVNISKFRCDTGDCGSILNMYGVQCKDVSGRPPASLAEFSLSQKGNDFYDLSNVDGYNVGMAITPMNFEKAGVDDPQFDCGAPRCVMNTKKCPPELQVIDIEGVVHCLSICQAIWNEAQRAKYPKLQELWEGKTERGFMKDFLCCDCGEGNGLCEALGSQCTYGCSPFVNSYTDPRYKTRFCDRINGTFLPDWPKSSTGENYAAVFSHQCPQAYSWQFNDDQSTYQCRHADYKIEFFVSKEEAEAAGPKASTKPHHYHRGTPHQSDDSKPDTYSDDEFKHA